jgi:phosphoenolpyruvate-protein kinase (PTS system EI component)
MRKLNQRKVRCIIREMDKGVDGCIPDSKTPGDNALLGWRVVKIPPEGGREFLSQAA